MPSPESMAFYYWCCLTIPTKRAVVRCQQLTLDAVTWTKRKRRVAVMVKIPCSSLETPLRMGRERRLSLPDVFSFISCSVFSFYSLSSKLIPVDILPGSTFVNFQNVDNMDEETA